MMKNEVGQNKLRQYQTTDLDKIKRYPPQFQEQLCSSIFRNSTHKDMFVEKSTINKHFKNKKQSVGSGRFLKKIKDDMYA